jgi:hypothetical protein
MALNANATPCLPYLGRRIFLWSMASFGLMGRTPHKPSETIYHFLTPEFEIEMSVQYFAKSSIKSFHFRDSLNGGRFCLSAEGEENQNCLGRFTGSVAIAHYHFTSRLRSQMPVNLRERVVTIDHDNRMHPPPPFERVLPLDRGFISDIQAFGYNLDDPKQAASTDKDVWCLLRQDLYLNDRATAFLIVHWKHTLNFINLLDVIPGDGTQTISE